MLEFEALQLRKSILVFSLRNFALIPFELQFNLNLGDLDFQLLVILGTLIEVEPQFLHIVSYVEKVLNFQFELGLLSFNLLIFLSFVVDLEI